MAALLSNPNLATNQAQMLLQQLSNINGQSNDADPEQLAANQMAAMNMALNMAAGLMPGAGNQGNNACSGKDGAQSNASGAMMTGLDVAHNAIINAFNASNAGDPTPPRAKRRRSAPQGDPGVFSSSPVTPPKYSRPRSAPGGATHALPQQLFPPLETNLTAAASSAAELRSPSQAVTMVTSSTSKSPVPSNAGNAHPPGLEGMPPLSAAPSVTTVTNSASQLISTACVAQQQPTSATTTVGAVTMPQLQNSVITPEQLNQLGLSVFNPQQLSNEQLMELQQQLQQQLINQQQQLFQGQGQLVSAEALQQQMGVVASHEPHVVAAAAGSVPADRCYWGRHAGPVTAFSDGHGRSATRPGLSATSPYQPHAKHSREGHATASTAGRGGRC